ncbi:hypothetical protein M404DRAFT_153377 [Pisolithus tinctorius Marx 270]|uniref:Uncharacterized protein n=1 Tax=Pisolithus tinctorius Marx 270 TaxID=870435 RepID=A0A0C3ITI4_PISTI|nr:hypothetical protein M404DRAFT_153377 [Pisolithus tinctorius Marx 270]
MSYANGSWSYADETDHAHNAEVVDGPPHPSIDEDDPDPFLIDEEVRSDNLDLADILEHITVIHALVSWLHLQFHLPCIACNALLAILTLLLFLLNPTATSPFTTLQSRNCLLGVNRPIHTLLVCPNCHDVYPLALSPHCHDTCTSCHIELFLPGQTLHGNTRMLKTPVIKYPYLPLSEQIVSILKIPGIEATLDEWQDKPQKPGMYMDIFNSNICHMKLKGPNGNLFFSNQMNECGGPNGELRLGVNLGVDWYALPTDFMIQLNILHDRFSYIQSNIPIVSDLLWLWKHGIKVPTESWLEGQLVHVALVAVVCDKPAAHKIGGFTSHSHTYFCTECWISVADKMNPNAFQQGDAEQCHLGNQYCNLVTLNAQKTFVKEYATQYSQLSRLPYFDLVAQIIIDLMHNLFLGAS